MAEMTLDEVKQFADELSLALESADPDSEYATEYHDMVAEARENLLDCRIVLDSILEENGVSRSMVVSLENFLPQNYPLNSFSRTPTQTNANETVVSLEQKNWTAISIFASAIIGLISTIITVIFGRQRGFSKEDAEKAAKLAERIDSKTKDQDVSAKKEQEDKFDDTVNGKDWTYLKQAISLDPDPLVVDVFKIGGAVYEDLVDRLEVASRALKDVADAGGKASDQGTLSRNAAVVDAVCAKITQRFNDREFPVEESAKGFVELTRQINSKFDAWASEPAKINFSINAYVDMMMREGAGIAWYVVNKDIDDVGRHNDKRLEKRIEAIRDNMKVVSDTEIKQTGHPSNFSAKELAEVEKAFQVEIQELVETINNAVSGILGYTKLRERILNEQAKAFKYLLSYDRQT